MSKFIVVRDLLVKLSLEHYFEKFEEAGYDDDCLTDATDSDLKEIGLLIGDRRKFMKLLKQNSSAKVIKDQLAKFYSNEEVTSFFRLDKTKLSFKACYVNLAVVLMESHNSWESREVKSFESGFMRPRSSEYIISDKRNIIELKNLFEKRQKSSLKIEKLWSDVRQKRILIFGRAGVGKTTLCKKIVNSYYEENLWKNYFHRVVWLALRDLKQYDKPAQKIHAELSNIYANRFFNNFEDGQSFADLIAEEEKEGKKVLYVLDGWDEIQDLLVEGHFMRKVLKDELLTKPFLIVTSRPHCSMELESLNFDDILETVGFTTKNINAYIANVMPGDIKNQNKVLNFINSHSITAGVASIPIQLDMLCYLCKNIEDLEKGLTANGITMSKLYDVLVKKMLDINNVRKLKSSNFEWISSDLKKCFQDYKIGNCPEIAHIVFLSKVAYKGLLEDRIEFNDAFFSGVNTSKDIRNEMKESYFLNCLNPSELAMEKKSYTFIHLTFQEFMAALYIVNCLEKEEMVTLIAKNKYHPRFQIVWSFVAGLIDDSEDLDKFFNYLEDAPIEITGLPHQFLILNCANECLDLLKNKRINRFLANLRSFWMITHSDLRNVSLPDLLVEKMAEHVLASGNGRGFVRLGQCEEQYLESSKWLPDSVMFKLIDTLFQEEFDRTTAMPEQGLIQDVEKYLSKDKFFSVRVQERIKEHVDNAIKRNEILRSAKPLKFLIGLLHNCNLSDTTHDSLIQLFDVINSFSGNRVLLEIQIVIADVIGNSAKNEKLLAKLSNMFLSKSDISILEQGILGMAKIKELPFSIQDTLADNFDSKIAVMLCKCLKEQTFLSPHALETVLLLLKTSEDNEIQINCLEVLASQRNLSAEILEEILKFYPNKSCVFNQNILNVFSKREELSESIANYFLEELDSRINTNCNYFRDLYQVLAKPKLPLRVVELLGDRFINYINDKKFKEDYILNIFKNKRFPQSMLKSLYSYLENTSNFVELPDIIYCFTSHCLFCDESSFPNYPLMVLELMKKTVCYPFVIDPLLRLFSNHQHLFENFELIRHFDKVVSNNSPNENDFNEVITLQAFAKCKTAPEELLLKTIRFLRKLITEKIFPRQHQMVTIRVILEGLLKSQTRLPKSAFQFVLENKLGYILRDLPLTDILENLNDSNWKDVFDSILGNKFASRRFPFQVIQITENKKALSIFLPTHKSPVEIKYLDVNYVVEVMRQQRLANRPDFLSLFLMFHTKRENLDYIQKFRTDFQIEKNNLLVYTDVLHKYLRIFLCIENPSEEDYRNLFEEIKLQLQSGRANNFLHIDLRSNRLQDDNIDQLKQTLVESGKKISTLILSDNQITCCRNGLRLLLDIEFIRKIGLKYLYLDRNHIYMRGDDFDEFLTDEDSLLLKSGLEILDLSGNFIPEGKLGGIKENVVAERHILEQSGIPEKDLLRNVIYMQNSSKVNSCTIEDNNYSFAPICNQFYTLRSDIEGRRIGKTEGCIILAYKASGIVGKHAFLGIDWVPNKQSPCYGQRQLIRSELLLSKGKSANHFFIRILQKSPDEFISDFTHASITVKGVAFVSTEKISKLLEKIYSTRDTADIYSYRLLASLNSSQRGEFNCITWADLMLKECDITIDSMGTDYWIPLALT